MEINDAGDLKYAGTKIEIDGASLSQDGNYVHHRRGKSSHASHWQKCSVHGLNSGFTHMDYSHTFTGGIDQRGLRLFSQTRGNFLRRIDEIRFFGFARILLTRKYEIIIVKEKINLYFEGYNGKSGLILLSSRGSMGQTCPTLVLLSSGVSHIDVCQTWDKPVMSCPILSSIPNAP
ncbi:hypothetical protein OROMI_025033 [Orobanche minor]